MKKWLPLQAKSDDKASSNISGDLELFVKWRYNPELDFDPYPDSELKPAYKDKEPNELRLALVQARGLAIKDKNLLSKGGSCSCVLVVPLPPSRTTAAPREARALSRGRVDGAEATRSHEDAIDETTPTTRCHGAGARFGTPSTHNPPQVPRTPSPNSR